MNLDEPEEIIALRDMLRRFVAKECTPEAVRKWDRDDLIPRDMTRKLAGLEIYGFCVPEEYGGMGRRVTAMAVAIEELTRGSGALASLYLMTASYGGLNISSAGSERQMQRFLPDVLAGRLVFTYGLSEPDTGADLGNVKTRAERHGDRVIINGAKRWTSGADLSDYIYALVRSGPAEAKRKNLSFVLIPTKAKGVKITRLGGMGTNGAALCDVSLDNVEVPFENVIGEEKGWNAGWQLLAGPALEVEKLGPSAMALGTAEAAVAEAWTYSQQRIQGGKHICGHQAVRHVLADAQTKLQACRLMLRHATQLVEAGADSAVATSMAKLYITEAAKEIVLNCQQYVMGAYGYAHGFNMERYVRDVLGGPIYGGSSAIQRNNIANLLKLPRE
jgi:alkylation response protein AidB-like acyl-CoA dehydrogenase